MGYIELDRLNNSGAGRKKESIILGPDEFKTEICSHLVNDLKAQQETIISYIDGCDVHSGSTFRDKVFFNRTCHFEKKSEAIIACH